MPGSASIASSSSRTRSAETVASAGPAARMACAVDGVRRRPSVASRRTPRSVRSGSSASTRASGTRSRRAPRSASPPVGSIDAGAAASQELAQGNRQGVHGEIAGREIAFERAPPASRSRRARRRARRRAPRRARDRAARRRRRAASATRRARSSAPDGTATSRSAIGRAPRPPPRRASRTAPPTSTGGRSRSAAFSTARRSVRAGGVR